MGRVQVERLSKLIEVPSLNAATICGAGHSLEAHCIWTSAGICSAPAQHAQGGHRSAGWSQEGPAPMRDCMKAPPTATDGAD